MASPYSNLFDKNKLKLSIINNGNLDENSPKYLEKVDFLKDITLKEHQLCFLYNAIKIETNTETKYKTNIAIYGDNVGSGKSLSILSLISLHSELSYINMPNEIYLQSNKGFLLYNKTYKYINTNIILVPHTIINQWELYIKKYTYLKYLKINTNKSSIFSEDSLTDNQVILLSNNFYGAFTEQLKILYNNDDIIFSRFIIDEADNIKFNNNIVLEAVMTWFITSSLENLLFPDGRYYVPDNWDNYSYVYTTKYVKGLHYKNFIRSIFDKLLLGSLESVNILNNIILKNSKKFVDSSFNLPEPKVFKYLCRTPININFIGKLNIGSFKDTLFSLINANDLSSISEKLGCDISNTKDLVDKLCSNMEKSLENEKKHYIYLESIDADNKQDRLTKCKKKIDEIQDNIDYIKNRIIDKNATCPICYDILGTPKCSSTCCYQMFCLECITNFFSSSSGKDGGCPCCRSKIGFSGLTLIGEQNQPKTILNKEEKFLELILTTDNKKWLVFSNYDASFTKLELLLKSNNISYSKLSGSVAHIDNVIKDFDNGKIKVLLLNAINFGMGLNLQMASDILIFHNLTTELEKQVIGRAQRPGRNGTLSIHYLCHSNEFN
jgi:hypothetical protein